jgi:NAD(P)-dependent dehydrogenase (short-subunit alcohol dehydrogenase family)
MLPRRHVLPAAGVHAFAMDVTDDASMVSGIERIIRERGRIDVLTTTRATAPRVFDAVVGTAFMGRP